MRLAPTCAAATEAAAITRMPGRHHACGAGVSPASARGELLDRLDKCRHGSWQGPAAVVGESQFAPELDIADRDQLGAAGLHILRRKAGADQRYADSLGDESLDHAHARH